MSNYFILLLIFACGTAHAQLSDFSKANFRRADSVAAHYRGKGLSNLPVLAHQLTVSLPSQVEQFRAIYTWVSTNIDNDYEYFIKNQKKRATLKGDTVALAQWNRKLRPKVFNRLLKEQKTICTGYAYLIRELATMANINCNIVDGYGRTATANIGGEGIPNHSWNTVQLGHQWYLCDATWSSGYFKLQGDQRQFIRTYNEGYFLSDPALFVKNHYPLDTAWLLMETKPSLSNFLSAPLVYGNAFKHHMIPITPNNMHVTLTKGKPVVFTLAVPDTIQVDRIRLVVGSTTDGSTIKPNLVRNAQGFLEIEYVPKKLGRYDIHVKMGDDHIITYVARVRRI